LAEFNELIKNFDKIRDYMRDFFVYGFKARGEFMQKSARTYDNEKRRIESYMGEYINWDTSSKGKRVFISLDSSKIYQNPLYSAWKSKSFTANDIMLHFFILDILKSHKSLSAEQITDMICDNYEECYSAQLIRIKANEYCSLGILNSNKEGKVLKYSLSQNYLNGFSTRVNDIYDMIMYYQEVAPIGEIGSFLLDNESITNNIFVFKHHFIVHTLEDNILLGLLKAIKEKRRISFTNASRRSGTNNIITGIPIKIFVSTQTGRRYVCIHSEVRKRFINFRLDYIKTVELLDKYDEWKSLYTSLEKSLEHCWGVSFGGNNRMEYICVKLYIDEIKENHILQRLKREGKNGKTIRIDTNVFLFTTEIYDTNEIVPWIKTFTGRIISIEGSNQYVTSKIYSDMQRMYEMYFEG